ncbi:MAG: NAD(P)H-binding protein [Prochlorotrichaceae cyanobacterium]
MKAFVAGATGATGQRIVNLLVDRQIPVRALVRDRSQAQNILPGEVELIQGDVSDSLALQGAIGDSTILLCATGARPSLNPSGPLSVDYLGVKNLVEAAQAKEIQQFVLVSSLCVSQLFHPLNLFWFILFWKLQGEKALQQSGIPYTIVRPGGLLNEDRPGNVVLQGADTLFEGSIPRTQVAQVCVEALFCPEARNKVVEIVSRSDATAKPWSELFAQVSSG